MRVPSSRRPHEERASAQGRPGSAPRALPVVPIGSEVVHLASRTEALAAVAASRRPGRPLAVASVNLDHIHQFPTGVARPGSAVDWLNLIDGAPVASQVRRITGHPYPKLSGSDLIGGILDDAARQRRTVAILGGSPACGSALAERFRSEWPEVNYLGQWAPARATLSSPLECRRIASALRVAGVDILIVCLGKPRQEAWIAEYGEETGAEVLLAFGAVVDFLAGRVARAPEWVSAAGLEWAWRLLLEPRRLAKRYLVQAPAAYVAVRRSRAA
ncbi:MULTISPECIES: WecB/TagA/CpsF family glycosyltransferase [Agrococcus]|uniref:WecB/TagA/CpsF family glycosyltransferase n=1 Tax=Agrococcus TaxID=46352 RepID=UPI000A000D72|nr:MULTISPECIES: WecB/TagA/CpsF family glycosyltransferase [Agrococcus]MBO1769106.1 WecB/TagA/CpsF family glycosyltransferase [Agrococcus sp. TF02-05]